MTYFERHAWTRKIELQTFAELRKPKILITSLFNFPTRLFLEVFYESVTYFCTSILIQLYRQVWRIFKIEFFQWNKETELFWVYLQEPKTASITTNVLNNSYMESTFKLNLATYTVYIFRSYRHNFSLNK